MRRGAEARFAHRPDPRLLRLIGDEPRARSAGAALRERVDELACFGFGLAFRIAAELDDEPAFALGQKLHVVLMHVLVAHVAEQHVVEAFDRDRAVLEHRGHAIAGRVDVREAEHRERAARRAWHEPQIRGEHERASAFAADERTRDVEAALGKQLVQAIARYAPRDVRIARADQVRVAVAQSLETRVELAARAAGRNDPSQLVLGRRPDPQALARIGQHVERVHVVDRAPGHYRVHAAGVVADHAAERVVIVRRRVGAEREVLLLGAISQRVEHAARFDDGAALRGV